jgi:hypothetical protein
MLQNNTQCVTLKVVKIKENYTLKYYFVGIFYRLVSFNK